MSFNKSLFYIKIKKVRIDEVIQGILRILNVMECKL